MLLEERVDVGVLRRSVGRSSRRSSLLLVWPALRCAAFTFVQPVLGLPTPRTQRLPFLFGRLAEENGQIWFSLGLSLMAIRTLIA